MYKSYCGGYIDSFNENNMTLKDYMYSIISLQLPQEIIDDMITKITFCQSLELPIDYFDKSKEKHIKVHSFNHSLLRSFIQ